MSRAERRAKRITARDFLLEDELLSFESSRSSQACKRAIAELDPLDATRREHAAKQLKEAIYQFVLEAVEEAEPPPSEVRNRLQEIAKQARKLDELITGPRDGKPPPEPLPAIRYALTAPSARETGKTNIAGVDVDGVTYLDDAPVKIAIEGVRAIERWVELALPRIERQVKKTRGGPQTGASKRAFLSALGDIYMDAAEQLPRLWADRDTGEACGRFARFAEAAIDALLMSVEPKFEQAAGNIHQSLVDLSESRIALYESLYRDVGLISLSKRHKTSKPEE